MVLTCFKSMTWVIENKTTTNKVALINLKVCIALLNIFIFHFFIISGHELSGSSVSLFASHNTTLE